MTEQIPWLSVPEVWRAVTTTKVSRKWNSTLTDKYPRDDNPNNLWEDNIGTHISSNSSRAQCSRVPGCELWSRRAFKNLEFTSRGSWFSIGAQVSKYSRSTYGQPICWNAGLFPNLHRSVHQCSTASKGNGLGPLTFLALLQFWTHDGYIGLLQLLTLKGGYIFPTSFRGSMQIRDDSIMGP